MNSSNRKEIEWDKVRRVTSLPKMNEPRDSHAMIAVDNYYLICVGGRVTKTCEKYNFLTNLWVNLPDLNQVRYFGSLFLHNGINLYYIFVNVNKQLKHGESCNV